MTEKFLNKLKGCISKNFKKIRINGQKKTRSEILFKKLRDIKDDDDGKLKKEIEDEIAASRSNRKVWFTSPDSF